jgi:hypothetical protein
MLQKCISSAHCGATWEAETVPIHFFLRIAIACWRFPYFFARSCTQRIVTPRKRRNVTDKISNFILWNRRRNWIIAYFAELEKEQ